MNELTVSRIVFIDQLHETFMAKKGYGAYAYISVTEAMHLFDQYSEGSEDIDRFIDRSVHSFKFTHI